MLFDILYVAGVGAVMHMQISANIKIEAAVIAKSLLGKHDYIVAITPHDMTLDLVA